MRTGKKSIDLSLLKPSQNTDIFQERLFAALYPNGYKPRILGDITLAMRDATRIVKTMEGGLPGHSDLEGKLRLLEKGTIAFSRFAGLGDENDRIELARKYLSDHLRDNPDSDGKLVLDNYRLGEPTAV